MRWLLLMTCAASCQLVDVGSVITTCRTAADCNASTCCNGLCRPTCAEALDGGGGVATDAGLDAGQLPRACAQTQGVGVWAPVLIDPDGAGPLPATLVSCDYRNLDGGWTLILSVLASSNGVSLADGGALTEHAPGPGVEGAWPGPFVRALAAQATQVHVRAVLPDGGLSKWISSRLTSPTPLANLANLRVLNAGTTGLATYTLFEGPNATANSLDWSPATNACDVKVSDAGYPNIYWACSNGLGLHLNFERNRWVWGSSSNEPMEVWLR